MPERHPENQPRLGLPLLPAGREKIRSTPAKSPSAAEKPFDIKPVGALGAALLGSGISRVGKGLAEEFWCCLIITLTSNNFVYSTKPDMGIEPGLRNARECGMAGVGSPPA
jgi:hypothetical protein